jgi:hypothetical protein
MYATDYFSNQDSVFFERGPGVETRSEFYDTWGDGDLNINFEGEELTSLLPSTKQTGLRQRRGIRVANEDLVAPAGESDPFLVDGEEGAAGALEREGVQGAELLTAREAAVLLSDIFSVVRNAYTVASDIADEWTNGNSTRSLGEKLARSATDVSLMFGLGTLGMSLGGPFWAGIGIFAGTDLFFCFTFVLLCDLIVHPPITRRKPGRWTPVRAFFWQGSTRYPGQV